MKETARGVAGRFREHELLLRASAIAFQVLTAVVPFVMFLLGVAGFLGLESVYQEDIAFELQRNVSAGAYAVIDNTVREVLGSRHTFWATVGLAIAVWQLSGAVRTVGATLDTLYEHDDERPFRERLLRSLWISAAVIACLGGALLAAAVSPLVYGDVGLALGALLWLARYALAAALLLLAIGIVVRFAPSERRPARWVSSGALLATAGWLGVTAAFGGYLAAIASFGSIYGVFISVVVLLAWTYASALAFVVGIATDAELTASS